MVEKSTAAVNQMPTVAIATPWNNQTFTLPSAISITANAADPDGTITRVEYYLTGIKIGESQVSPYSMTLDCDSAGTYEITARAFDNLNASVTSEPVRFSIYPLKSNPELITVYPNPNHGTFKIEMTAKVEDSDAYEISVVSLNGKTVCSFLAHLLKSTGPLTFPALPAGVILSWFHYTEELSLRGNL